MDLASPPLENKPKQDSNDKKFQSQKSMGAGSNFPSLGFNFG